MIDFFIIGAPKAGTTALHSILNQHSDVFLPGFKEPHFFADDLGGYKAHSDEVDFMALYEKAGDQLKGDASIFSLYSDVAVENILKHNPDAKFIVVLRRQYETVPSFHSQLLFTQDETLPLLADAWGLVEKRRLGEEIPKSCRCPKILDYKNIYKYGYQIERLLEKVTIQKVKFIFHDDLKRNPEKVFDEVLKFLGLPHQKLENKIVNSNEVNRFSFISRILRHPPHWLKKTKRFVLGKKGGALYKMILKLNTSTEKRVALSQELKEEIISNYKDDIVKLEGILGRDLNEWYQQ